MSDLQAFEEFIDVVTKAVQPVNEGGRDYFYYIIEHQNFVELSDETTAAYKAARAELAFNVRSLPDKSARFAYLNEAKSLLVQHAEFDNFITEFYAPLVKDLSTSCGGQRSIREEAFVQMQRIVDRHFDASNELSTASPELPTADKGRLATLQLVGTGASGHWEQLQAAIATQLRLVGSTLPADPAAAENRKAETIANFDEYEFIEELGFDTAMLIIFDKILVGMKAIVLGTDEKWRPTPSNATGLSFIALYKLLIAFKQVDKPKYRDLADWVMFFEKRYQANITEGIKRYQIDTTVSEPFREELRSCYRLIISCLPKLKGVYHLPSF